jgi:ribosomal-protein-alanine N-acetyltransferase
MDFSGKSKDIKFHFKPLELRDIDDDYCEWFKNDDGHLNYFTGSGRVFTKDIIIKDFNDGLNSKKWFYYLALDDDGTKIGNVKIGPIDLKNMTSDLVCLIGNRRYLGKGLAAELIKVANEIAFKLHYVRRLQGGMIESNIPSIKAYTRAGWFIEAEMKGFYLVNNKNQNRVCVACLNPDYFEEDNEK